VCGEAGSVYRQPSPPLCALQVEEEARAVFNCLSTFENIVETDPSIAEQVGKVRVRVGLRDGARVS